MNRSRLGIDRKIFGRLDVEEIALRGCAASALRRLANRKRGKRVVLFLLRRDVVDLGFGAGTGFGGCAGGVRRRRYRRRPAASGGGFSPKGLDYGQLSALDGLDYGGLSRRVRRPRARTQTPSPSGYRDAGFSSMALTRTA